MKRLIERCCGLDVHKATVSACVRVTQRPGGEVKQEVRTFATTTPELLPLREWLSEQRGECRKFCVWSHTMTPLEGGRNGYGG
jgi:hypothetical protein